MKKTAVGFWQVSNASEEINMESHAYENFSEVSTWSGKQKSRWQS